DYLIQNVTSQLDLTTARGKAEAANTLMPLIREMSDGVARTHYVQDLARRLRMDERGLLEAGQPAKPSPVLLRTVARREAVAPVPEKIVFGPEEYCLAMLLRHPETLDGVERLGLQPGDFVTTENSQLYAALKTWGEYYAESAEGIPLMSAEAVTEMLVTRYEALIEFGGRY